MKLSSLLFAATLLSSAFTIRCEPNEPYYSTSHPDDLGPANPDAALGNPYKGLMDSPWWNYPPYPEDVPSSLDMYYLGLNDLMLDDPDVVGPEEAFNWTKLDDLLEDSASRDRHVVLTVNLHYPYEPLNVSSPLNQSMHTEACIYPHPWLVFHFFSRLKGPTVLD